MNCKKENWRDVETGNIDLTLGGLAKGVSLPKISYEVRWLVQSGGHGLRSAVSCAHGEVAQGYGVVISHVPYPWQISGLRGVKKIPLEVVRCRSLWAVYSAIPVTES